MKLENKDKFGNLIGKQRFFSITVAQNPDLSFTVTITAFSIQIIQFNFKF